MDMTLEDKYELIKKYCLTTASKNPIEIANEIMQNKGINMHGPEHHFLDGAAFLTAYNNSGGNIDLAVCLDELAQRTASMPGAMCGYWGVCGSVTAIGAALSIINNTSPLSQDEFYKNNMQYTSKVIGIMSKIGGPRCCKRNAYLSISNAVKFVKETYGIDIELSPISCDFYPHNEQCLKNKCPFYPRETKTK